MSKLEDELLEKIKNAQLPQPVRELRFHPGRMWRFDFAYPDRMLAIEVQGGTWTRGKAGHSYGTGIELDAEKLSEAAILGWRVILLTQKMIRGRGTKALDLIGRALAGPAGVQTWVDMQKEQ